MSTKAYCCLNCAGFKDCCGICGECSACCQGCDTRGCAVTAFFNNGKFYRNFIYTYEFDFKLMNGYNGDLLENETIRVRTKYSSKTGQCTGNYSYNYKIVDDDNDTTGAISCTSTQKGFTCKHSNCNKKFIPPECESITYMTGGGEFCNVCAKIEESTCNDVVTCGYCYADDDNCGAISIFGKIKTDIQFTEIVRLYNSKGEDVGNIINADYNPNIPCKIWGAPACHIFY